MFLGRMIDIICNKSHKEWRKLVKKLRRKRIRQGLAEIRKKEEKKRESSPTFLIMLAKKKLLEEHELELYEKERKERHEKWLRDEEEAQKIWSEQQRIIQLAKEEKMKELERIRSEWEAEQQRIKQKKEELERLREEEEKRKERTLEKINDFIINGGEVPVELMTVTESNAGKELCPFFAKVGACRFGHQCSRNHQSPGISKVLLLSNFYSHFTLEQSHNSEYDTDIGLEYEEYDKYLHFEEFYNDVAPELKKYGNVKMIKVCCNIETHLRGNVYVEYTSLREALIAYHKFHGRWYSGKQINAEFVNISDWGKAVCGDFARHRCPKGKSCNFLHVFKNPRNEFPIEWNRSNSLRSFSPNETNSSVRSRSFRWSETPVRAVRNNEEKCGENGYKHKSKRKSRSRSRERRERRCMRHEKKRKANHHDKSYKRARLKKGD